MKMDTIRLRPVNECIYCPAKPGPDLLSDEHIIPYCLDGNTVLPKASCLHCAKITASVEQHLGRSVLGDFRLSHNMRSRRKRDRPSSIKTTLLTPEGAKNVVHIPKEEHPAPFPLIFFPQARWISGETELPKEVSVGYVLTRESPYNENIDLASRNIDFYSYAVAMMKIAHCLAVMWLGVDGFNHVLPPIILDRKGVDISPYFGCTPENKQAEPHPSHIHSIELRTYHGRFLVVIGVRLFAHIGSSTSKLPTYQIVAGTFEGSMIHRYRNRMPFQSADA